MKIIICIAIPVLIGALSGYFTVSGVNGWYTTIRQPWYTPPNSVFGPVWMVLYVLMGIGLYLVYNTPTATPFKKEAMVFFSIQMVLNFFWSFIFFYKQQIGFALAEIIVLWMAIVAMIFFFSKVNKTAAYLQLPYISWVSFATILNYGFWKLN